MLYICISSSLSENSSADNKTDDKVDIPMFMSILFLLSMNLKRLSDHVIGQGCFSVWICMLKHTCRRRKLQSCLFYPQDLTARLTTF